MRLTLRLISWLAPLILAGCGLPYVESYYRASGAGQPETIHSHCSLISGSSFEMDGATLYVSASLPHKYPSDSPSNQVTAFIQLASLHEVRFESSQIHYTSNASSIPATIAIERLSIIDVPADRSKLYPIVQTSVLDPITSPACTLKKPLCRTDIDFSVSLPKDAESGFQIELPSLVIDGKIFSVGQIRFERKQGVGYCMCCGV